METDAPGSTAFVVGDCDGVPETVGVTELVAVSVTFDRVVDETKPMCSGSAAK